MADLSDDPVPPPGYVVERTPEGGWRLRPTFDVEMMNRSLRFHCDIMEESPQRAALYSLNIVIHYLVETGIDRDVLQPLSALADALDDLCLGIRNPLLEPPLTEDGEVMPPAKRLSHNYAFNMAFAAAAVTLAGHGHMKATAQRAALKLGVTAARLETFRRNLATGKIRDPWATWVYSFHVDQFKSAPSEVRCGFIETTMKKFLGPIRTE